MKFYFLILLFIFSACVPPEEEEGSTFYEDDATREVMNNLRNNQGSPLSSNPGQPSRDSALLDYLRNNNSEYETLKKPDLAGRWYLYNLYGEIYTQHSSTKSPSNKEILKTSLIKNVNVFGSACDPNEVIAKGSTQATTEITNPDSKCDNRDFWDPMRRDTSILRNGWKISMCGQLNQGFSFNDRPLDLLKEMYFSESKTTGTEVSVNERSIKIAYHLFNRFHTPPTELMSALIKINDLNLQSLGSDPGNYSKDEEGTELNSGESLNVKKWRRIFYLLCIDPNNEII